MKSRYKIYNPLASFYARNPNRGYEDFLKKYDNQDKKALFDKIKKLTKLGYKEAYDATGGDHDYLVIDSKLKQWCWWENGFAPFCGNIKNFPVNFNLEYWGENRK